MLTDREGQTIDVGRKTRVISPALRRALEHRDGGCQFPGCSNTRFDDAHHIQHWINGGETNLQNTISICRRHHRFVHEWNYSIERFEDARVFVRPDGQRVSAAPPRPDVSPMSGHLIAKLVTDNRFAADAGGEPVDYEGCAIALLSPSGIALRPCGGVASAAPEPGPASGDCAPR